jgi:predicted alpha/beta-fold hydrolase
MTVLIVHGLEGSSESAYMVGCTHKALAAGMNVVRMNVRNCGGTEGLSPTLYHSGLSADIGAVARALLSEKHLERLALVGFSMGGNLVLKLAGEWSREAPPQLKAVATVCPSIELSASADALHRLRNRIYEQYFLIKLKRRMRRKAGLFPKTFQDMRLRGLRSIRDFDDKVTAHYCGFAGAADYYARASSLPMIERIAVPTFILHAQDDPFILLLPRTREAISRNSNIRLVETKHGGHCGFIADPDGYDGRWAEQQVIEFLSRVDIG